MTCVMQIYHEMISPEHEVFHFTYQLQTNKIKTYRIVCVCRFGLSYCVSGFLAHFLKKE
jgi:hypothetical protein